MIIIIFIFSLASYSQGIEEGLRKLQEARNMEQRLYPEFTSTLFENTIALYQSAGDIFWKQISGKTPESYHASYYCALSWLHQSQLLEAMNKSRAICDIYVNTFDKILIPEPSMKLPLGLTFVGYDTVYMQTLELLFYNAQECHKDIYVIKYGNFLKSRKLTPTLTGDVYAGIMQAYLNVDLFEDAFNFITAFYRASPKPVLNEEQREIIRRCNRDLKNRGSEILDAEKMKLLDKWY